MQHHTQNANCLRFRTYHSDTVFDTCIIVGFIHAGEQESRRVIWQLAEMLDDWRRLEITSGIVFLNVYKPRTA